MVIGDTVEPDATDLDWTVYGIAHIPGNHDVASWRADRGDGKVFVGVVGSSG
jgi:thiamine monophosphate kinase